MESQFKKPIARTRTRKSALMTMKVPESKLSKMRKWVTSMVNKKRFKWKESFISRMAPFG